MLCFLFEFVLLLPRQQQTTVRSSTIGGYLDTLLNKSAVAAATPSFPTTKASVFFVLLTIFATTSQITSIITASIIILSLLLLRLLRPIPRIDALASHIQLYRYTTVSPFNKSITYYTQQAPDFMFFVFFFAVHFCFFFFVYRLRKDRVQNCSRSIDFKFK